MHFSNLTGSQLVMEFTQNALMWVMFPQDVIHHQSLHIFTQSLPNETDTRSRFNVAIFTFLMKPFTVVDFLSGNWCKSSLFSNLSTQLYSSEGYVNIGTFDIQYHNFKYLAIGILTSLEWLDNIHIEEVGWVICRPHFPQVWSLSTSNNFQCTTGAHAATNWLLKDNI